MQIYDIPIDRRGRELTTVGTAAFPVAVYETQLSKNILGYVNWHWHEAIQLCLVTKGSVTVNIGQKEYTLSEGEGCFIHTNVLHMIRPKEDPHSTYICVNAELPLIYGFEGSAVHKKYVLPTISHPDFRGRVLSPSLPEEKEIINGIRRIYVADNERKPGYEMMIIGELLSIWHILLQGNNRGITALEEPRPKEDTRLKEMISFLQNHYGEKLTLEQIAASIHLCPGECCRFCKRNMGKTIFTYLQEYRVEQSIRSLAETAKPISEIAYDCGFSSTSHYIDRFKKQTGKTPLEYRKNHKSR